MKNPLIKKLSLLGAALLLAGSAFGTGDEYYNHTTYPSQGAVGSSSALRAELDLIEAGFGKLPTLTGNGGKIAAVNAGGTAIEAITTTGTGSGVRATSPTLVTPVLGVATATSLNKVAITAPATGATLSLADGATLATSGAYSSTFTFTGATNVTFPTSGTLLTSSGAAANLTGGVAGSIVFQSATSTTGFSAAGTTGQAVLSGGTGSPTFTTGTLALGGNFATSGASALTLTTTGATNVTLPTTGTVATLAGSETLTNKGINGSNNTVTNVSLTTAVTGTLPVANGGTGIATTTAYSPVFTGTTATGAFQATLGPGTAGQVLTSGGAGALPTWTSASGVTSGTAQATTSGSNIDFTGLPAGIKRITISFAGTSTNGTNGQVVQIGDSGGLETSGYLGASITTTSGGNGANQYNTSGFGIRAFAAADVIHGSMVLTLLDAATNTWVQTGVFHKSNAAEGITTSGSKALTGTLDRVRITTNSAEAYDAGSINILYE